MSSLPLRVALSSAIEAAVSRAVDGACRVDVPFDWPVLDALREINHPSIETLRVGVLPPFSDSLESDALSSLNAEVATTASEITRWRNDLVSEGDSGEFHLVVLGPASGVQEAGLRLLSQILTERDVLTSWQEAVQAWFTENIESHAPRSFVEEIFKMAESGLVDAPALDEYLQVVTAESTGVIDRLGDNLWILGLCPDRRLLDRGRTATRLSQNEETMTFLTSAGGTTLMERQLSRIQALAAEGNETAAAVIRYRQSDDKTELQGIQLSEVLELRAGDGPTPSPSTMVLDLFDVLDAPTKAYVIDVEQVLEALSGQWNVHSHQKIVLTESLNSRRDDDDDETDEQKRVEVRVEVIPTEELGDAPFRWTSRDEADGQGIVSLIVPASASKDWLPAPENHRSIMGERLLRTAEQQDRIVGEEYYHELALKYLQERARLEPYETWLRKSGLELLVLKKEAREAVQDFLDAWLKLVKAVGNRGPFDAGRLRTFVNRLECMLGWDEEIGDTEQWCILGPFHPYVLHPILALADYIQGNIGTVGLGARASWAFDHSVPAYGLIWLGEEELGLESQDDIHLYSKSSVRRHLDARSGDGLTRVAESFLGFHEYAHQGLVLALVNPPSGPALGRNLSRMRSRIQGQRLRVFVVSTSGTPLEHEELGEGVTLLGRYPSIGEWLDSGPVRSHITCVFASSTRVRAAPGRQLGPVPGAFVSPQIRLDPPDFYTTSMDDRLEPRVTFVPRDDNEIVGGMLQFARASHETPRVFDVEPMLDPATEGNLAALAKYSDWLVVGAPSPLGLVAPQHLGEDLTYIGRETLGPFALFVYASSLFPIRKLLAQEMRSSPIEMGHEAMEERLTQLAVDSPNGLLRMARSGHPAKQEQVGLIVSTNLVGIG